MSFECYEINSNIRSKPGKSTGRLIQFNINGLVPPDARVLFTNFNDIDSLLLAIAAKLKTEDEVNVQILLSGNSLFREDHVVFSSDKIM